MKNKAIKVLLNEMAEISSSMMPCEKHGLGMVKGFQALGLLTEQDAQRYTRKLWLAANTRRLLLRKVQIESMINPNGVAHHE